GVYPAAAPVALRTSCYARSLRDALPIYPVPAGGGTTAWVLVDDTRLDPGEPQLKPVVRALAAAITGGEVSDHRAALTAYAQLRGDRKSTRLNSSHVNISYAVFCVKKTTR